MTKLFGLLLGSTLALTACSKGADGPPCDRLAVALCDKDTAPCKAFIDTSNEGKDAAKKDAWCASIVDDPSAVKVFKDDARKGAAGVK